MQRNSLFRSHYQFEAKLITTILLIFILSSCSLNQKENSDSGEKDEHQFHADNDIAMTIKSIVDAINVDEPIKSEDYDFEGILTDGRGRPLYTDIHGNPGEWIIEVKSANSVAIRNNATGDLLPDDLQEYILTALGTPIKKEIYSDEYDDDLETSMQIFDIGKGTIRFERREVISQPGVENVLLNIVIAAK